MNLKGEEQDRYLCELSQVDSSEAKVPDVHGNTDRSSSGANMLKNCSSMLFVDLFDPNSLETKFKVTLIWRCPKILTHVIILDLQNAARRFENMDGKIKTTLKNRNISMVIFGYIYCMARIFVYFKYSIL